MEDGDYALIDGELYSLLLPHSHATAHPRKMVPEDERTELINEAHTDTGHRSWQPILRYIQTYCVWPGMTADVKRRLALCPHCQGNRQAPRPSLLELIDPKPPIL